jgi:L-lysine exporter family protein LysE/ArgO
MFPISSFANGFGLTAGLIVAIGAQNTFVLRQGLRREHVGPVVFFCALADLLLVACGVLGVGEGLRALPGVRSVLTGGGAAFLLWYGAGALRRAAAPGVLQAAQGQGSSQLAAVLGKTAAVTLLNPHVYLDTLLLMGAIGGSLATSAQPYFVAGAGTASAIWYMALGFGARLLAPVFARPSAWRVLDGAVAASMFSLASLLAVETYRQIF